MKIQLVKEASCSPFFLANSTGDILEGENPLFADLVEAGFAKVVEEPAADALAQSTETKAPAKPKKA